MWKTLLKGIISINFPTFVHYLITINLPWYVLAITIQIISALTAAYKWELIMKNMGYNAPFSYYARTYFIGTVFNQVLPTSVGGDAVRIAYTNKLGAGLRKAFNGVMVDRYYGTVGLVLLNLIPLFWLSRVLPQHIFMILLIITVAVGIGLLFALMVCKIHLLARFKITHIIYELSQAIVDSATSVQHTISLLLLAILSNFLTILALYYIAIALNLPINFLSLLAIIPAITLITLLPISFAG